ncbi:PspA/IM30 family protein [Corynebacterium aquatimens]|uniref:PspA/IM30 family protein n=1 Tax=Corynebacterium TaxID=1716 RepID=UPI0025463A2A|nr:MULTISPECIES: PspA/IM30 family protein [Corynebacterium]QYH19068.1 PspA/IM30 family protein [Corynebacterium aquatimens]UIZ92080.1 PspA/IM30 family protein [Corynebacterium sp. CNCTC7651]
MANPFSKGWNYLMQSFDSKIDQNADPRVQIQQAVAQAKKNHQEISQHAAQIIGNRNQLEMKLERLIKSQADLQAKTRTALQAADKATAAGDAEKAQQYNATAEVLASQLVSVENELAQTKEAHAAADHAAREAQAQQQQSEARLQEQLQQVSQLESQLNQAKMQEQTTRTMDTINQFGGNDNVPTLDSVRDKIERRYADALGAQELAKNSMTDRMAEIEAAGTDVAASSRLDEIRASMAGELEAGSGAGAQNAEAIEAPAGEQQGQGAGAAAAGAGAAGGAGASNAGASNDDILADAEAYLAEDAEIVEDADAEEAGQR